MSPLFRKNLYIAVILLLLGLLAIAMPYAFAGLDVPVSDPVAKLLQDLGIALCLAGTVSFAIEELIKSRTRDEFQVQMRSLLKHTEKRMQEDLQGFVKQNISDFARRLEVLKIESENSNIEMIFHDRQHGMQNMAHAMMDAEKILYLMGISLRPFFQIETPCSKAISEIQKKDIDIRVLLLNPCSPDALERSAREEGVSFKSMTEAEYQAANLNTDVHKTIKIIRKKRPNIQLKIYNNLSLFLLITDAFVFLEPYHLGKRLYDTDDALYMRLAEQIPMIQFRKSAQTGLGAYEQFLDHFLYMFGMAKDAEEL